MKSLMIIGYGEYGHVVEEIAIDCGYKKIGFLDDKEKEALDSIDNYAKYQREYNDFIVAIGNPVTRRLLTDKMHDAFNLVTLIHSTAIVSRNAIIEPGCIIEPHVVVHRAAHIKECCIINAGAVLNHDCIVESYSQIGCNSVVGARATVPEGTKVNHCQMFKA